MTTYAFNASSGDLIATWPAGVGVAAKTVASVGAGASQFASGPERRLAIMALVANLNHLSTAMWKTYTHYDGNADPSVVNSRAWRLEQSREDLAGVLGLLSNPDPASIMSYSAVTESASRVGRALVDLDDPALHAGIEAAVAEELDAVDKASYGDLSGLAQQALAMSRFSSSPVQVQAAWRLLDADPLGCLIDTLATVDPTSASVAAAEWLRHAAMEATGVAIGDEDADPSWVDAIQEADHIQVMPVGTATDVLADFYATNTARGIVERMVRDAVGVSEGRLSDPDFVDEQEERIDDYAHARADAGFNPVEDVYYLTRQIRVCRLDPTRPALDLLEDLHESLWGCFLLWSDTNGHLADHLTADLDPDDDWSEETSRNIHFHLLGEFTERLRARAATVDHLSL